MRVFLTHFDNFTLAIPTYFVSYISRNNDHSDLQYLSDLKSMSIPSLFNLNEIDINHKIILKNNFVLLTAKVNEEIVITEKEIYSIPKTFGVFKFSKIFSGIKFDNNRMILILNPENLNYFYKKEEK